MEDEQGRFGWGAPEDEEAHSYINQLASSAGTYLYGRRMYETMVSWETAHAVPNHPQFVLEWARQWQAAEKIVYSRTLAEPCSLRTRIGREFDPDVVRRLKGDALATTSPLMGPGSPRKALRVGLVVRSLKRIGDSIEETDMRDGKSISVAKMTVSADCKTMTIDVDDKLHGTEATYFAVKQ